MHEETRQDGSSVDPKKAAQLLGGGTLVAYGLTRRSVSGLGLVGIGGWLILRSQRSGGQKSQPSGPIRVAHSVTINRPVSEVYSRWRDLEHLPQFLDERGGSSVTEMDRKTSHWFLKGPMGTRFSWDAVIVEERENQRIAWKSTEDSQVKHTGSVSFRELPGNRGTAVKVEIDYTPPGGLFGEKAGRLLGDSPTQWVYDYLHRFKQLMEAGEVATTSGQSAGAGGRMPNPERLWGLARQLADTARTLGARQPANQ